MYVNDKFFKLSSYLSLQVRTMEAKLAEVQEGSHILQRMLDSATQDIVQLKQSMAIETSSHIIGNHKHSGPQAIKIQ